ncbi:MAG: hypothetical protein EGP03_02085 [SAR202 cluster bacterium]|jgi:hypothetical protein|nr:MAG: hypothetical protein EGP03_02085 [SAR202 cluster bacterium]
MMLKEAWILLSLWMGGFGHEYYIFDSPKFTSKRSCVIYVMQHHRALDMHVSKQFGTEFINNKFWCVEAEALRKRLDEVKAIPL